jgi:penicillin V acylase-like amidase (Ntn superfamily)
LALYQNNDLLKIHLAEVMCLRVLNNLNEQYPVTGRNINWFRPIDISLYRFAQGLEKQGLTRRQMHTFELSQSAVFKWQSTYASVVAMMGDDEQDSGIDSFINLSKGC